MRNLVDVQIEERSGVVVAHVAGELDLASARETGDAIEHGVPTSARGLVIDFSRLEFIDSSGVSMLFRLARALSSRRQALRLVAAPDSPVARVLEIVEFERAAPVDADLDAALSELDAGPAG